MGAERMLREPSSSRCSRRNSVRLHTQEIGQKKFTRSAKTCGRCGGRPWGFDALLLLRAMLGYSAFF